jgi:flavin reductase (DIM6/NTAB) family NADH-FMN oxidoreductase RutF
MENFMSDKKADINLIDESVFKLIGDDWMLVTSGNINSFNTMTASWGGMGVLWNKPVSYIFIRPTRYTYEFLEKNETYTLSFFTEKYRKALSLCGSKSGRDTDKVKEAGLTPEETVKDMVSFKEAKLVIECKKLYFQDINPANFLDASINKMYNNDYHRMYIGEITSIRKK